MIADDDFSKFNATIFHFIFMTFGMIIASFLSLPVITRISMIVIIPLNLLSYLKSGEDASLDYTSLVTILLMITMGKVFNQFFSIFIIFLLIYCIVLNSSICDFCRTLLKNKKKHFHESKSFSLQQIKFKYKSGCSYQKFSDINIKWE